jgi:hypothetical protein
MIQNTKRTLVLAFTLVLVTAGLSSAHLLDFLHDRDAVRGSGDVITVDRLVKDFVKIKSSGAYDLYVTVGDAPALSITFDDNLVDLVETEVRGKTLYIDSEESYSSRRPCRVDITISKLESVSISGSGDMEITGLNQESLSYEISGSGDLVASGSVEELDIKVSGSGDVDTRELKAKEAYVRIYGSGDVSVYAVNSFDGAIFGSGDIRYYGDPEYVSTDVAGSGDIRKR